MGYIDNNIGIVNLRLGAYLKDLRNSIGMSLAKVEEISGVSASYICRIENGERRNLTLDIFYRLAKCYNKSLVFLLFIAFGQEEEPKAVEGLSDLIMGKEFIFAEKKADINLKLQLIAILRQIEKHNNSRENDRDILQKIDVLNDYIKSGQD